MTEERVKEIAEMLGTDEEKLIELIEMSPEDAAKTLQGQGHDVKAQELIDFGEYVKKQVETDGELDESELDRVSGGTRFFGLYPISPSIGFYKRVKTWPW